MSRYQKLTVSLLIISAGMAVAGRWWPIAWGWYLLPLVLYLLICSVGSFVMAFNFFLPARCRGEQAEKVIAITFDDGPIAGYTNRLLALLAEADVRAAFFCIGSRVAAHPEIAAQLVAAGHVVGNHSYSHRPNFGFLSQKSVARELADADQALRVATGKQPRFFRPPFGVTNPMIARAVGAAEYQTIGWSVRSFDTVIKNGDKLWSRVTKSLRSGDIVLFHDYSEAMLSILPAFIRTVHQQGFRIVPLNELLNENAYR